LSALRKTFNRPGFGRRSSLLHAVLLVEGRAPIRCLARDVDENGAFLELGHAIKLPYRFRLQWEDLGVGAECEVLDADGAHVRIGFTTAEGPSVVRRFGGPRA
jgi:hypothetical protein